MFIAHIGDSVHKTAFATEQEALDYIIGQSGHLGATQHALAPDVFGKRHRYLNPYTDRWNSGSYRVSEVEFPA